MQPWLLFSDSSSALGTWVRLGQNLLDQLEKGLRLWFLWYLLLLQEVLLLFGFSARSSITRDLDLQLS